MHRSRFPKLRAEFPEAPRPRANGDHSVSAWQEFISEHTEILSRKDSSAKKAELELERLRQLCRRLKHQNELLEGAHIPRQVMVDHLTRFAAETRFILRQKLENEWPADCQGKTVPEIRRQGKAVVDQILASFRAHFETWTT